MNNITYIILAAGKGINLYPLTLKHPKTSFKLDQNTTVLQRNIRQIRKFDKSCEIVVVLGYLADKIKSELENENVKFVINPFYEVTNSISSLWFARDYLERENVAIIHGDVVFEDELVKDFISIKTQFPYVFIDTNGGKIGTHNAVISENKVRVMSKKLEKFDAKYACMTKLDAVSSRLLKQEIDEMVSENMYDQYYEDALVQMILFNNFELFYKDISDYDWTEVDNVDDLLKAKKINLD